MTENQVSFVVGSALALIIWSLTGWTVIDALGVTLKPSIGGALLGFLFSVLWFASYHVAGKKK